MDELLVRSKHCLQIEGYLALREVSLFGVFFGPYLSVFSLNAGKYGLEKSRIRTLFMQCRALPNIYGGTVLREIVNGF